MENTSPTSSNARAGFSNWLSSSAGAELAACERQSLERVLPKLFGYHALQVGYYNEGALMAARRIRNKFELRLEADGARDRPCAALGRETALPFAAHSIDLVLLPHVLEYAAQPDAVLQEVERVLVEDGRLVVTGFNPWSPWGLWRLSPWSREQAPWDGRFHGAFKLRQQLAGLGFEVLEREWFPPPGRRRPLSPNGAEKGCRPWFGAAYFMLAQKRRAPVTPVKPKWRRGLFLSGASAGSATMAKPGTG